MAPVQSCYHFPYWESQHAGISPFEGGHHYPYHGLASGQTTVKEHSPTHQQKIGLKIYWAWPHPPEQDPVSYSLPPIRKLTSFLSSSIRGQTGWKPQSWKTNQTESQPHLTQWNYESCCVGPPKRDRSWWRVLTKCGALEKGMANHFSILALRTPWTIWKDKKILPWKMNFPGQ